MGRVRKQKEFNAAKVMYCEQGLPANTIAEKLNVSEKTIGDWVERGNWKALRNAKQNSNEKRIENINRMIDLDTERKLSLLEQLKDTSKRDDKELILKEIAGIDDGISKWNKLLENINKENEVSLSTYLLIQQRIFSALQRDYPSLFEKTLEFQDEHIDEVVQLLG